MSYLRPLVSGLLAAVISVLILIGGLSASLAEGTRPFPPTSPVETAAPTQNPEALVTILPRPSHTLAQAATPAPLRVNTATSQPSTPICPPPEGWVLHTIQADETLESLAQDYQTTVSRLIQGNCLVTTSLVPGTTLKVPDVVPPTVEPTATATNRLASCGPPDGWVTYTVKRQDTLFRLAQTFKTSVRELQWANCKGTSSLIVTGERIYVPFSPTQEPPAGTSTSYPTSNGTEAATETAAQAAAPTGTETSKPIQTVAPSPTATPTSEPTTSSYLRG
ncbi:MAG TPA: LysM peptidoglycan-binding domain-containing protein [Anaerolineaceae bacterium]|nr:LysM peptidoglycan-binding domain-containing protein [Anaerolineaceae bacterium]